jgi:Flp pilus assembly protein TadG
VWIDLRTGRQTGQNVVELALAVSFLMTMTLGLVDFGRAFYAHVGLTNAAREGARRATMLDTCTGADLTAIRDRVKAEQPSLGIADSMISVYSVTAGDNCSNPSRRSVSIVYSFQPASPFLDRVVGDGNGKIRLNTWATLPVAL